MNNKIVSILLLLTSSSPLCAAQQNKHPHISRGSEISMLSSGILTIFLQFTVRNSKNVRTLHTATCTLGLTDSEIYEYSTRRYSVCDEAYRLTILADEQTAKEKFKKLEALFEKQR